MELTKESLQHRIDQYAANAEAFNIMYDRSKTIDKALKMSYYLGKQSAYIDLYKELFPEMESERAFPLDEENRKQQVDFILRINNFNR